MSISVVLIESLNYMVSKDIGLGIEVSHLFPVAIAINDFRELRSRLFELSKTLLMAA